MSRKATDYIIIHCAATRPCQDIGAKEIDRWHRAKGWLKIGYHFVIKRDGTLETGRKIDEPGAHAEGYNERSVGVCLVGGINDDLQPENNFTAQQWTELEHIVRNLMMAYPQAKVIGHNQISSKACPSFDVQQWVKDTFAAN